MAWGGDRLAIRQVAYALAIALAFGVMFGVASLARDVVQERQRIRAAGESVLALVRAPAARAADILDPVLGATLVTSALEVPFVVRAELTDTQGQPIAAASRATTAARPAAIRSPSSRGAPSWGISTSRQVPGSERTAFRYAVSAPSRSS